MSYNECPEEYEGYEIRTQGGLINRLIKLRNEKRTLESQLKLIEQQYNEAKQDLIQQFKDSNTLSGKTPAGSATYTTRIIANLVDPNAFWAYIFTTRDTSLISHARPATKACQELQLMNTPVPGVEFIEIPDISLRSA
jgi:hypothetical protein